MAVTLDGHQLVDPLRTEAGDPADVVAGEVDEHDVFSKLFRVLDKLRLEPAVFSVIRTRRRVPAIGRDTTRPLRTWTIGSGDAPMTETPPWRRKNMYGLGFTCRSTR